MSNSKKLKVNCLFLLFILFTFQINNIQSQCNPTLNIQPAYSCFDAQNGITGFACDLDGFCINTSEVPFVNPPIAFCTTNSVLNNPIWFSFLSDSSSFLDIEITPGECSGGLQWALYDQCGNYFNSVACESFPVLPADTPFEISRFIQAGVIYYLVIDGANGASCNLQFKVNSGIAPVSVQAGDSTDLTGDINICPTLSDTFSFAGFNYANTYEWSLDGIPLDTTNIASITFTVPLLDEGTYELCVKGTNDCDPEGLQLCWDLAVTTDQTLTLNEIVCPGDSVLYQNAFYKAGNYILDYIGLNTCIESLQLNVEEYYLPADTTYAAFICYDLNSFEHSGIIYQTDSLYENVPFQNEGGCFYTGKLHVSQLDISQYNITGTLDELPCNSPIYSTLTLEGPILPASISNRITWFNSAGQFLGEGKRVDVDQPGDYRATVTQIYRYPRPIDNPRVDTCTLTFNYTIKNLTEIVTDPVLAPGLQTPETGEYEVKITNPENYPAGTEFIWIVPSGILYSELTEGISLYLPVAGTYRICMYAKDDCSRSDTSCYDIIVTETLSSGTTLKYKAVKLKQNPVDEYLIMDLSNMNQLQINIKVLDLKGYIIKDETVTPEGETIILKVESLEAGVYLYQIREESGWLKTGKFIKM